MVQELNVSLDRILLRMKVEMQQQHTLWCYRGLNRIIDGFSKVRKFLSFVNLRNGNIQLLNIEIDKVLAKQISQLF